MTPNGNFFWCELNTWNPEQAMTFYREAAGWVYERIDNQDGEGDYWLCMADGVPVAGILTYTSPRFDGYKDVWIPYIAVEDVDQKVAAGLAAGATIRREPWELPNVGRVAMLNSSEGAVIALITLID